MLLHLHNTLAIHETRVHTMPPSLVLSRLLEESGMAAAYSMASSYSDANSAIDGSWRPADHADEEAVAAMFYVREAAAVGKFLRYLAMLEQERSLTGGGATHWCGRKQNFLCICAKIPYLKHREANVCFCLTGLLLRFSFHTYTHCARRVKILLWI